MIKTEAGFIDFHSHILPGVDDGADSLETSLNMLALSKKQGVDRIVSTSHYYNFRESVESFVKRRDDAVYNLCRHINEHDMDLPEIITAAEVRLFPGMHTEENLESLCVDGTKNILVEMPYSTWSSWMYNEIYALISKGYKPIMAHIERFLGSVKEKDITENILSMDVYVQCNADSLPDRKMKKFIKKLIKANRLTVIGSDCHNMNERISHFDDLCEYISKKFGEDYLNVIMENAAYLLEN